MSDIWNEFPMEVAEKKWRQFLAVDTRTGRLSVPRTDGDIPGDDELERLFGCMRVSATFEALEFITDAVEKCCLNQALREGMEKKDADTVAARGRPMTVITEQDLIAACSTTTQQDPLPPPEAAEPEKEFLFVAMAKISAASLEDAEDHLYATLCIPGDIGFSINSYAIIAENGNQLRFLDGRVRFKEIGEEDES